MKRFRRATALLASFAVLGATIAGGGDPVSAQSAQPMSVIPPIIGNTASGLRAVPLRYLAAIEAFESNAVAEVLETHGLPPSDGDTVRAWGRDAVRAQEFLDLMGIITKPAANRTAGDAQVYAWFRDLYQQQQIDQAQAAVDQYLDWSGLTLATMGDDPVPALPGGGGYCAFRPPAALDGGIGMFDETYKTTYLQQCNGAGGLAQCQGLATGCPIPWPSVEQFEQWGRYVSQQAVFDDPVYPNVAMEVSVGVGLAATMVATGVATAVARSYLAVPGRGAGLFAKVFPHAARSTYKFLDLGVDATTAAVKAQQLAQRTATTAARVSASVVRVGAIAFVVGTVITAIVTIALEAWTIIEHQKIPVTLRELLAKAQSTVPDLAALADGDGGVGVLLTTFLSTTTIDVDPECQMPTPSNPYSSFPCANAPDPAAASANDDRFYVTTSESGSAVGHVTSSIYTVNPIDSMGPVTANESVRLSGNGWFVTTKHDGTRPDNLHVPTVPGATGQNLRLYYRDWQGTARVAERIVGAGGTPKFIVTSLDSADVGRCSTPPSAGVTSPCLTDTIEYVEPDGTEATARIVTVAQIAPTVDALVPARATAGEPITLSATATSALGASPFTYQWTLPGATLVGATVTASIGIAGGQVVRLDVTDANHITTTRTYPVLVSQHTRIGIGIWPGSPARYGSTPQVWADVSPVNFEGLQCTWDSNGTGEVSCVLPTGSVQFLVDGVPVGDPVRVEPGYEPPCARPGGCSVTVGDGHVSAPAIIISTVAAAPGGSLTVGAVYSGDDKFVGSSNSSGLDIAQGTPDVTLTSASRLTSFAMVTPGTLTATVFPKPGSAGVPTGTVRFLANGSTFAFGGAVVVDSDGTATAHYNSLQYVSSITVSYSGDTNFAPTNHAYPIVLVPPASAEVTPASSLVAVGTTVDLTITVRDADGNPMAAETVTIRSEPITGVITGADGKATLSVSSAVVGTVTYAVTVSGIANLGSATVRYGTAPSVSVASAVGEIGRPLSIPLSTGGDPVPSVRVDGLPPGLFFDPATNTVLGVPAVPGVTAATAIATNGIGSSSAAVTIEVVPPPVISTSALPNGTVGAAYQATVAVTGGRGPFAYAATGLPSGLSIDASSGRISGTPTADVVAAVGVVVTDALGGVAPRLLALTIVLPPVPDLATSMTSSTLRVGLVATYTITVANNGTAGSGSIVITDPLPSGISYVGKTNSTWRCAVVLRVVVCTHAALNPGQRSSVVLNVRVNARRGTVVTNTATASPARGETNTSNNSASITRAVVR